MFLRLIWTENLKVPNTNSVNSTCFLQETAANFPKPNRLSIFHYSPSASPSPPSDVRNRAFTEGFGGKGQLLVRSITSKRSIHSFTQGC